MYVIHRENEVRQVPVKIYSSRTWSYAQCFSYFSLLKLFRAEIKQIYEEMLCIITSREELLWPCRDIISGRSLYEEQPPVVRVITDPTTFIEVDTIPEAILCYFCSYCVFGLLYPTLN